MCAWECGNQKPRKNTLISNKEILERKGFLDEKEAKLLFYQFLRNNVTFATDLLCDTTLLPFQHIMIKSMLESDYFLGVISRGGSKCTKSDVLVSTNKGVKRIKDVEVGEYILAKDNYCLVESKTVNIIQPTYKITTDKGYESEGLDYHKVYVLNEDLTMSWKLSKDLKVGDVVVLRYGGSFCEQPDIFEGFSFKPLTKSNNFKKINVRGASINDWYYYFGLLLGDGCFSNKRVYIGTQDLEIKSFLAKFYSEIGVHSQVYKVKNSKKDFWNISISNTMFSQFLEFCGFVQGKKAFEKIIPHKLLTCSEQNACLLLKGLCDTDATCGGFVRDNEKSIKAAKVEFYSASKVMIDQVRFLLLMLGIRSSTRLFKAAQKMMVVKQECYCKDLWSLTISSSEAVSKFRHKVGFLIERKKSKLDFIESFNRIGLVGGSIPSIGKHFRKKAGFKTKFFGEGAEREKLVFTDNISALALRKFIKWFPEDKELIEQLLNKNIFFEKIKSITMSEAETVDIQVKGEHCYMADGFINHNSWSTGIYAFLDAVFNQGIQIGILAASFRQSKLLFKKIEDLAAKPGAYLMRQAITKVQHSSDSWSMDVGRSRIIALPLGDGEKLRGYRFNRIIIDEFLLMPERIVTEVISPFLAVITDPIARKNMHDLQTKLIAQGDLKEEDRYEWPSNKLIALSSASYKFENLYKYYQNYERLILNPKIDDKARRCIIQLSYESLPSQLYDGNQIQQAKATMSEAQFSREYGAQFTNESEGFFSVQKMLACTVPEGELPCVEVVGNPADEYIIGLDSSWAESETSDSFAIQVLKLLPEKKSTVLVHSYEVPGMALKDHIAYFHYLLSNFNTVAICMDMNGGLTFMSACNESECFKKSGILLKTIDTKFDKAEEYNSDLIAAKNEYNRLNHRYVIQRIPTSQWIRTANELMQAYLDNKRVYFASQAFDTEFRRQINKNIGISNLKYKRKSLEEQSLDNVEWDKNEGNVSDTRNKALMIDFLDHLHDTIQLTKTQLAMITPTTSIQGTQTFDLPKNVKGSGRDRARKDSYSALILANWMAKIYFDLQSVNVEETDSTFTPMMI